MKITSSQYKIAGESILAIPMLLLIILGVGEMIEGDRSGIQHFFELVPFVTLALISWFYPKLGGIILATTAVFLAILYVMFFTSFPVIFRALNDIILFLPPFVAGILFFTSGYDSVDDERGMYDNRL